MGLESSRKRYYIFKTKEFVLSMKSKKTLFILALLCLLGAIVFINEHHRKTETIMKILGFRNTSEHLWPNEDTTLFDATKGCHFKGKNLDAVIIVTTLPSSKDRRYAIRKTWENWKYTPGNNAMVFFFTGRPLPHEMEEIQQEVKLHGDLIVEDLEESYYGLTIKTLRMLKWYLSHCGRSKFLIKTDDDVFIHVPNMLKYLQGIMQNGQADDFVGGLIHNDRSAHNWNPFTKWYVPSQLLRPSLLDSALPPYAGGPCYVLSSSTTLKLYNTSLQVPLFNLEDVYLTGIVAHKSLGITLHSIPGIYDAHYPKIQYYVSRSRNLRESCTAFHTDGDINLMFQLYDLFMS